MPEPRTVIGWAAIVNALISAVLLTAGVRFLDRLDRIEERQNIGRELGAEIKERLKHLEDTKNSRHDCGEG